MPQFRKKPVTISAWQWNGEKAGQMAGVCQCDSNSCPHVHTAHENTIDDRGQLVFLSEGDWIVPEAKKPGRYYPIKPDVFAETYEVVDTPEFIVGALTDAMVHGQGVISTHVPYPGLMNGDRAEFELDHANTKPEDRPDWPLPSFDAQDWAKAFCKINPVIDEGAMLSWFANALMRGYDEAMSRRGSEQN
jgi:hypothetical protein